MPYLPNEIWLLMFPYCNDRDMWLSLRTVSRQLKDCVEQYLEHEVLPHMVVSLPIALPTYDIRNPLRGRAVLHLCSSREGNKRNANVDRVSYQLVETEPAHCWTHFRDRWVAMKDANGGCLDDSLRWAMHLHGRTARMRLKGARIDGGYGTEAEKARMSFEWKPLSGSRL